MLAIAPRAQAYKVNQLKFSRRTTWRTRITTHIKEKEWTKLTKLSPISSDKIEVTPTKETDRITQAVLIEGIEHTQIIEHINSSKLTEATKVMEVTQVGAFSKGNEAFEATKVTTSTKITTKMKTTKIIKITWLTKAPVPIEFAVESFDCILWKWKLYFRFTQEIA
ncbi:hypothetical protein MMC34_004700 [Xylographa carneopallida]|nr:hypothetical protein [Xylographa carneopallida]